MDRLTFDRFWSRLFFIVGFVAIGASITLMVVDERGRWAYLITIAIGLAILLWGHLIRSGKV